jgi:hypothetical protein
MAPRLLPQWAAMCPTKQLTTRCPESEVLIEDELRRLSRVEQAVLKVLFGVPGKGKSASASALPLSQAQARRVERRALRKLRAGAMGDAADVAADDDEQRLFIITQADWRSMENRELLNMAAFKLRECAQRMQTLAQVAQSPALGAKFLRVYRHLLRQEGEIRSILGALADVEAAAKPAAGVTAV